MAASSSVRLGVKIRPGLACFRVYICIAGDHYRGDPRPPILISKRQRKGLESWAEVVKRAGREVFHDK